MCWMLDGSATCCINEFLDDSIVLPPWKWEDRELVPFEQMKIKSDFLRQRRTALTKRPSELDGLLRVRTEISEDSPTWSSTSSPTDPRRSSWSPELALSRSGLLFGGARREFKRRAPFLLSDYTDAFTTKCITSLVFIFLSCVFLAITFGAILSDKTKGVIGVKETLVATSGGGIIFALLSAQPVMLIGVSGPMLIFEESLFKLSGTLEVDYLGQRVWVAVWACIATLVTVAFEGSFLIRFVTRFSDDILCTLLSVIFISESFFFLEATFSANPVNDVGFACNQTSRASNWTRDREVDQSLGVVRLIENRPNIALLSLVFVVGTFALALLFNHIRNSRFFGRQVRRALGDFGLSFAILTMVCLDKFIISSHAVTERVVVSEGAEPHLGDGSERPWFIKPEVSVWAIGLSSLPGIILFFVLFLETVVVELELSKKSHGLTKGTGLHWDLLVTGVLLVLCALFGLPWLCGVPVRSMAHLHSLTEYQLRAPGQKPRVKRVVEQRLTGITLHMLIGLVLVWGSVLRAIPIAVLFGVFLYIGFINVQGVQMISRALLFFVPVKYHPHALYCLRVSRWRMYLFTVIQLGVFTLVCVVKSVKTVSFLFPLAVGLTVLFRHLVLPFIFNRVELMALDGDGDGQEEETDFYENTRLPV